MSHSLDEFQKQRDVALQDISGKLLAGDRDLLLTQAMLQRYSMDRPRTVVTDVASAGTADLPLPTSSNATFEDGFSSVMAIEYPIGSVPANLLLDEDWIWYRSPSALLIRLLSTTPPNAQSIRVTWTARHLDDGSTVPDQDFEAVCDCAAALCLEALAKNYAQTGDATLSADSVNYRTKSQEYLGLAKAVWKRYFDHMGISDDPKVASVGPALAIGSIHENIAGAQVDRLTHPRATR